MLAIVTSLYASLTALIFIGLAFRVIKLRRKHGIGLSDGGNQDLMQAMRVHQNLVESGPLFLILLLILELNQASTLLLHVFGSLFILARLLHAWGFSQQPGYSRGRFSGAIITFTLLVVMALANVYFLMRTL